MIEKLKSYLDGLFAAVPFTSEVKEAKDELYDSMIERYEDCIRDGMDEQAAYDCVIDSIGNIHELFDELDFGGAQQESGKTEAEQAESKYQKAGEQAASDLGDFVRSVTDFASGLVSGLFGSGDAQQNDGGSHELKLVNTIAISTGDISYINVDYVSESIRVKYSDDDTLVVNEYMNREDSTLHAEAVLSGGGVTVRHGRRGAMFGLRSRIEVFLPKDWHGNFNVVSTSGQIIMEDTWQFSSFSAKTVSGDIELGGVAANSVRLSTTSGSIAVQSCDGEMELRTISGNILVDNAAGRGMFNTTSGGIRVSFGSLTGPLRLGSVSGGVRLNLPADASVEIDASSVSGSIHTAFDSSLTFQKRSKAHGFVGEAPYYAVKISTTSGGIHIND